MRPAAPSHAAARGTGVSTESCKLDVVFIPESGLFVSDAMILEPCAWISLQSPRCSADHAQRRTANLRCPDLMPPMNVLIAHLISVRAPAEDAQRAVS